MAIDERTPLKLVGRRMRRSDAPARLTGQTSFTDDLALPGLLHARLVRSPYASARIRSIDVTAAEALPGVVRVLTARDLPVTNLLHAVEQRDILLALDLVFHAGQPVAIVIGQTEAEAEDGMAAVEVEYEPLPAAVNARLSLRLDAPPVRERGERDEAELAMHGAATSASAEVETPRGPNVTNHVHYERGNVEEGFSACAAIVEREFTTPWIHQSYIEPQTCLATVDPLGGVTVYACTQAMFRTRDMVASTLGLPTHKVNVHAMPVGGGFGGKFGLIEPMVAACAVAMKRPVRLTYTRSDEFGAANPAPPSSIRIKAGARADGTLSALKADVVIEAGAKPGSPAGQVAMMLGAFYRWEHLFLDATEVLTNKTPQGAYRAPGTPQAAFAIESTVDELAARLGMDPLAIRRQNAVKEGDIRPDKSRWQRIGLLECLERAEAILAAERAAVGPNEGVGIALGGWFGGVEPSSALCRLEPDGTLHVSLGSVDLTGTNSAFQMVAAEAFGLDDADQVRVTTADTNSAPYAGATGGSKTMYTVGTSVLRAAADAREQVLRIAAAELEVAAEDLEIVGGEVRVRGVPEKLRSLQEISRLSASFGARYQPVLGTGGSAITDRSPGTGVHIVRVRVDPDTGKVTPLRYTVIQDVGRAVNPALVEAQIHGGGAQGVGWGLYEELVFDENGTPITASLMDYTIAKASQIPELCTVLVEIASAHGPFGAKGVGEPPIIPGGAAIANAVRDAVGARVTDLPLTPERVRRAMDQR